MPASIGVNLRVTGHCRQGGRKYMEDFFSVAYQQTEDERDLEYAFFGIYDGHGGAEAASYAKEHLMETIVRHKNFWSDNDEDVLRAIKDGYIATHYAMWKEQEKWPKTAYGLPSTSGTTASIAFIRRGKIYIGHVGDSGIILGYQEPGCPEWRARPLTMDHKPENEAELRRIEQCGGKVVAKSGVPRVVWNRPRIGHQGPVRRSTPIDEIPFLAVARSLGDLWSYNSRLDEFVVSPDPDCSVIPIDTGTFRCLVFGTDGLYNMLSPQMAVSIVQQAERHNENAALGDSMNNVWLNPSRCLVDKALKRWSTTKMRADNTSVVTLMLDPPGPPRAQVLRNKRNQGAYPDSGLQIMTRYENAENQQNTIINEENLYQTDRRNQNENAYAQKTETPQKSPTELEKPSVKTPEDDFVAKPRESTSFDPRFNGSDVDSTNSDTDPVVAKNPKKDEENIQINEISSSSSDFFDVTECESCETTKKETPKSQQIGNRPEIEEANSPRVTRSKRGNSEVFPPNLKRAKCETAAASTSRSLRERKSVVKGETPEAAIVNKRISLQKKKLLRKVLSPKKLRFAYNQMQKKPVFTKKITSTVGVVQKTRKSAKASPKKKAVRKAVVAPKVRKTVKVVDKESEKEDKENVYGKARNGRTRSSLKLEGNVSSVRVENSAKVSSSNEKRSSTVNGDFKVTKKEMPNVPARVLKTKAKDKSKSTSNVVLKKGKTLRSGFNMLSMTKNLRKSVRKKK